MAGLDPDIYRSLVKPGDDEMRGSSVDRILF
jgi:hypothetical protein